MISYNKKIINKNFSNKAYDYENHAIVQKYAASELLKKLNLIIDLKNFNHKKIIDLGSGTSLIRKEFCKISQGQDNLFYELDLSLKMLKSSQNNSPNLFKIQSDIENLPLQQNNFDLILSSFVFHWLDDYQKIFSDIFSLIKPQGILAFCLPVSGSCAQLKELNFININNFPNIIHLNNCLENVGFKAISINHQKYSQPFENAIEAIHSFKKIGANYAFNNIDASPKNFTNLKNFYKKNLHNSGKKFSLDWQIYFYFLKKNV